MDQLPEPHPDRIAYLPLPVLIGKVIAELPAVGKDSKAPAQMGGYSFRGIEDIVAALKPVLGRYGVFYLPNVIERIDSTRQVKGGGTQYVVDLRIVWRFYGPAGDWLDVGPVWGEGTDMGDKSVQKAATSALKTMLGQVFVIGDAASDSERHIVPDTDQADPEAWFHANGWLGGKAQHDERYRVLADTIRSLSDDQRTTMKVAIAEVGEAEGVDWRGAWTAPMAERVETILAEVAQEQPDTAGGQNPPSKAPEAPESPTTAATGEPGDDPFQMCDMCSDFITGTPHTDPGTGAIVCWRCADELKAVKATQPTLGDRAAKIGAKAKAR